MNVSQMTVTDLIAVAALVVALYGALLSSILGMAELRRNRPALRVRAGYGVLYNGSGKPSEPMVLLEAINIGQRTVTLTGVGWIHPKKLRSMILIPYNLTFPTELHEGKSCLTAYPCRAFREDYGEKNVIGVFFQDQTGKEWLGKISKRDRELWMKSKSDGWHLEWDSRLRIWIPEPTSKLMV